MHEAELNIPGLPLAAQHGHVVPHLATQPLLSIGQLCDAGCDVAFTASMVTISHNNSVVLQGQCTAKSKLWELNICPPPTASANAALRTASAADLVAFAHAALFSPALSTLEEALRQGHLPEFAGINPCLPAEAPTTIGCHYQRPLGPNLNEPAIYQATNAICTPQ